jgi:hypothetical protein
MPGETAAAALSIVASVLSITRSVKELKRKNDSSKEDALALFRRGANKAEKDILSRPGASAAVLQMMIISDALLQQLDREARRCEKRHIEDREEADGNHGKLQQADNKATQCMCNVLRALKSFNNDELPAGDFQDWWDSYRCPS